MQVNTNNYSPSFNGLTKIYALTDSHQETRRTSAFLSKILAEAKQDKNVLFLNGGDMFKGIYSQPLERDCYLAMKAAKPDAEMVFTIGNNDFGFVKQNLDFLIDTIKQFTKKGIHTVCANIFESTGKRPSWLKPYTVVELDGDRTFVTGFCIDNINTVKFGIVAKKQTEVLDEISEAIAKEKPDNVVVLNHDFMPTSKSIVEALKEKGVNVDVTIGGHAHDPVESNEALRIYYPEAFSETMYKMSLENTDGAKGFSVDEIVRNQGLKLDEVFAPAIESYEKESKLLDRIVPYTLNLTKQYSSPCPLGSFLADEMKAVAGTDVSFFSTGFIMQPMDYRPNEYITKYLFKRTMSAETPIRVAHLSAKELKEVFEHAFRDYGFVDSNSKFLQCSNNMKFEGRPNVEKGVWELKQIYIDGKPLFDKNGNPLDKSKQYTCAIDYFIAQGGQGFSMIKAANKSEVFINDEQARIDEILLNGLKEAAINYLPGSQYPCFKIAEV
jgi:2',3'-cyclic-nucleotide 2'-phosphodiesterase (5'-nucleotidase family)